LIERLNIIADITSTRQNGPENLEAKISIISKLDAMTPAGVPIASSSSGLVASTFITGCTHDSSRILIGHPFNPPHIVPLVEVVPHPGTAEGTLRRATQFYKDLGKVPVVIKKELPGFVANRLQAAINNEAFSLVERGIITPQDLDQLVTAGPGLRWAAQGPFMTNVLAGGRGGFGHHLRHLGPNRAAWMDDMIKYRFDYLDESKVSQLEENCKELLAEAEATGLEKLEEQRDERLQSILQSG
jgi:3-hydroxyacyl-CoA dehydrogenase